MDYIDLTHTFTDNMPVFPGDPTPSLKQRAFIKNDTYNDYEVETVMHVGTHLDAPFHMIEEGKKMDEILPEKFFGPGILLDVRGRKSVDESAIEGITIPKGAIVLLFTGWGEKYGTPEYAEGYPEIKESFAQKMVELKVKMVGMDIFGPDHDVPWPIHVQLLKHEILLIENVTNLGQLLNIAEFEVIALPAKFHADAAPVRVIARIV